MQTILLVGGTGYIGKNLEQFLLDKGYSVKILTRNPVKDNHVLWNPEKLMVESEKCQDIQVIVNLCGEGISKKRWTNEQRQLLIDSRVEVTKSLFEMRHYFPKLQHYVSASGITAYGFDDGLTEHQETDNYGTDFLSQLVKKWEEAADMFQKTVTVSKLRIAVVFEWNIGALKQMSNPIKMGIGSPLGSGKQQIPWVHITDLVRLIEFVIENKLEGTFNTNAANHSNEEITRAIAKKLKKRLWMPNVPAFILKIVLGKLSEMVLFGAKASNEKIKQKGFSFSVDSLGKALDE
jgi:uncharacterized protein (TIGR01777 family)